MPTGTKEEFEAADARNRCYSPIKGASIDPPKGGSGGPFTKDFYYC